MLPFMYLPDPLRLYIANRLVKLEENCEVVKKSISTNNENTEESNRHKNNQLEFLRILQYDIVTLQQTNRSNIKRFVTKEIRELTKFLGEVDKNKEAPWSSPETIRSVKEHIELLRRFK